MKITGNALTAARDAALECISIRYRVHMLLVGLIEKANRDDIDFAKFGAQIEALVERTELVIDRLDRLIDDDMLTALEVTSVHNKPVMYGQQSYTTYHESARCFAVTLINAIRNSRGEAVALDAALKGIPRDDRQRWESGIRQETAKALTAFGVHHPDMVASYATEHDAVPLEDHSVPLTDTEQAVYDLIPATPKAIQGPQIISSIKIPLENSTLTRHIIPALKKKRGILNQRGSGYYRPAT